MRVMGLPFLTDTIVLNETKTHGLEDKGRNCSGIRSKSLQRREVMSELVKDRQAGSVYTSNNSSEARRESKPRGETAKQTPRTKGRLEPLRSATH